jgi:hypothetical protein
VTGECPPQLFAKAESFLNQTSSPSLGIYFVDNVLYQFTHINLGLQRQTQINPMFGGISGYLTSQETLNGSSLHVTAVSTDTAGNINWSFSFRGQLENGMFRFQKYSVNNIVGKGLKSTLQCIYKKEI